jgi:PAS domain S-box-containing protein
MGDSAPSPYLLKLFDIMAEGVLLVDAAGRIVQVNPALERLLETPRQRLEGQFYSQALGHLLREDSAPMETADLLALSDQVQQSAIVRLVLGLQLPGSPGGIRWIEAHITPLQDEAGAFAGAVGVVRDITAQRVVEESLRQYGEALERMVAERTAALARANSLLRAEMERSDRLQAKTRHSLSLLRATLQATSDGILVRDLGGKPLLYNRSFREIFGKRPTRLSRQDLEDPHFALLEEYADPDEAREQFRAMIEEPGQSRVDLLRLKDGRLIERRVRPERVRGEVVGRVSTFRDVTEQRRLEAALRERTTFLWSVIDASPTNIFIRDLEGRYQLVNRTLAELYGLSVGDFIGRSAIEIADRIGVPHAESTAYVELDRWVIETGQVRITEGPFTRLGHETLWFETIKVPLREDGRIIGVLGVATERTEQRRMLAAQQASEERYRGLVENAPVGIFSINLEGEITEINPQALRIFGAPSAEAVRALNLRRQHPQVLAAFRDDVAQVLRTGQPLYDETPLQTIWEERHGTMRYHLAPMRDGEGQITGVQAIIEDVSEYRQLQEQLRQVSKLQAIGQLAGGVAHNFNNLLTVINGYAEMALAGLAPDDPLQSDLAQIYQAGRQAADLTRQLLTFSRRQTVEVTVFDLNAALKGLSGMLASLLGETIALHYELAPQELVIRADRAQVEQMALNLGINGRDAMPGGGTLTIRTRAVTLNGSTTPHYLQATLGPHAVLEISDTGEGMSPAVQERLFEPFFTTKPVDRGTGLGLATLYGAMQQLGGALDVESAPGQGATFRLYLPLAVDAEPQSPVGQAQLPRGRERVLVVEDRREVREATTSMLQRLGYQVTSADGPTEAMRLCHSQLEPFDLILIDVMMPTMSGAELAQALPGMGWQAPVLLMSGSADDALAARGVRSDLPLIPKPFTIEQLARAVREVLGGPIVD